MARILVIDDNADLLQMVRMLLEQRGGHEVILSAEGEDGIAKALANPPDLAIIDVMMPGMTGYEVCKRLRKEPSTANIPIIILTARGQPVDREAALAAGANEYLAKPVTMAQLLERVNGLLAQKPVRGGGALGGVVALISLRGGVGVTTLAVNLALTLARPAPERVCLVDLCPSSGHAALQLGLRPDPNWAGLALLPSIPSEAVIRASLLTHATQLRLLAAPFVPVVGGGLTSEKVQAILAVLRRDFSTVVVDLPSVLTETAIAALEAADFIGVVTAADQPTIQTTLGTLQALKAWMGKARMILNQPTPGVAPSVEALQRVVKQPFAGVVPFDPAQAQALAQGKPLALADPDSPLAQGVARVAAGWGGT